jgi:hypothetical protein
MSDPRTRVAAPLLIAVAALFGWWAWKQGAYFGSVFYAGAFLVFAVVALVLAFAPFRMRIDGPARVAMLALLAFAGWTFLSTLWTTTPGSAIEYGEQATVYVALFVLGLWLVQQLRERALYVLMPIAVAGAVVGIATVIVLATGTDVPWYLHDDGTLRFPIGYRNADACFFIACLWPLLGISTWSDLHWAARALAGAFGTMLLELAILGQSRGSLPAVGFAFLVYLIFAPRRLRAAIFAALVLIPALPALPTLLHVFQLGTDGPGQIPLLRDSAKAIALTTAGSFLLSVLAIAVVDRRVEISATRVKVLSWVTGIGAALVVLVAGGVVVARHGGPVSFVDQRIDQFREVGYPNLHAQGVRFGLNVSSDRQDFWRVSVDEGLEHPLLGGGAGSFYLAYQQHRRSPEIPHDPHSVEAMAFGELGFPGIVLLAVFVGAAAWAAARSRRRGPPAIAAALTAAAVAGSTQWVFQASYDWLWHYPAVTGIGVFLLGAAGGLGLTKEVASGGERVQRGIAIGILAVVAILAIPLFASSRYVRAGEEKLPHDIPGAVADFQNAADLDPLSGEPLILKGVAAADAGASSVAIKSFQEAESREPDFYLPHLLLAREYMATNPAAARAELAIARMRNPLDPEIALLARELKKSASAPRQKRGQAGATPPPAK